MRRLRRFGLLTAFASACIPALIDAEASYASHLGAPSAPPATAPPAVSDPPPAAPPEPTPTRPDQAVKVAASDVFLLGRKISVPLACQRSGQMSLSRKGHRLGSDRFKCEQFAAVGTVKTKRSVARGLARKLANRASLKLRAKFNVKGEVLRASLNLRQGTATKSDRSARRAGLWWTSGYLSCGGRYSSPPGLALKTPGVSASGQPTPPFHFFVNDTNDYNWVNYRLWLFEYGHGWFPVRVGAEWEGWIELPPGTGANVAPTGLFSWPAPAYLAGAIEVYWWNGLKDWNWVFTSAPALDSTVYDSYWCYAA